MRVSAPAEGGGASRGASGQPRIPPDWRWDEREQCLTLCPPATQAAGGAAVAGAGAYPRPIVLPLGGTAAFTAAMEALTQREWEEVKATIQQLTRRPVGDQFAARAPLGEFGFRLLRFAESRARTSWFKGRYRSWRGPHGGVRETPEGYRALAESLLVGLGPDGPETAWRLAFDEQLPFSRRSDMVMATKQHLLALSEGENASPAALANPPERRLRELFWWTVRSHFELACAWERSEGIRNPKARHVLHESSLAYLNLLKDEPHRRELDEFLQQGGSSVEAEVDRIFALKEKGPNRARTGGHGSLRTDEAVRRIFFLWYLKRYNLTSAYKLITNPAGIGEVVIAWGFFLLVLLLLLAFAAADVGYLGTAFKEKLTAGAFLIPQIGLQLVSLLLFIVLAPNLSRLALPRALFGTLMAWLTVIGAYAFGLADDVRKPLHQALMDHGSTSVLTAVGLMVIAYLFMFNEVRGHVPTKRLAARRVSVSLGIMLLGAMFWGLIFSVPLKILLERGLEVKAKLDHCLLYLTFVGGCAAVVFGILVQLLWDDRSITEPLGEPL